MKNKTQRPIIGSKTSPLTLKKFLIQAVPALYNKPKRREAAWREFRRSDGALYHQFNLQGSRWWTIKQLADHVSETGEIPDDVCHILALAFMSWYAQWRKERTSKSRSAAAIKSHKKTGARPNWVALKEIGRRRLLT